MHSVFAELVHKKTKISNMFYWHNIFAAYPDGDMVNFLKLFTSSKNDELSLVIIKFQHIPGHPVSDFLTPVGPGLKLR